MEEIERIYSKKVDEIKSKLESFARINPTDREKEFVFCLLTPQSNAQRCWEAVEEIFSLENASEEKINEILIRKTRFHNMKSKRVVEGLKFWPEVEKRLSDSTLELRNWLADNVSGYGLKEASHFLRNIGKSKNKIAILDRHILRNLKKYGVISEEKIKSKKNYFEIEKKFIDYSNSIKIPVDELDLVWWSEENGEIFK